MTVITPPRDGVARAAPRRSRRRTLTSVGALERTPIPSVVLVPDGWVIWHNDAAAEILGGPERRELLGRSLPAFVDVDGDVATRWMAARNPNRVMARLHHADDAEGLELRATRLENGSLLVQFLRPSVPSEPHDTTRSERRCSS